MIFKCDLISVYELSSIKCGTEVTIYIILTSGSVARFRSKYDLCFCTKKVVSYIYVYYMTRIRNLTEYLWWSIYKYDIVGGVFQCLYID